MKVVHIVPTISNPFAGTTEAVISLCCAQFELGVDVELVTLSPIPDIYLNLPFKVYQFPRTKFPHYALGRSPEMKENLTNIIKQSDIVHTHMLWMAPCYYAGIIAKRLGKIHICSPHGSLTEYALKKSRLNKLVSLFLGQQKSLSGVSKFHLTAESERDDLAKTIWNGKSFIVSNGINGPSDLIKKKQTKTLLFLSRIHPKKGLDILITSFLETRKEFPEWSLKIIGPVEDKSYFQSFKSKICEENGIFYLGGISGELRFSHMQNSDVFVLPTHSENFGLVVGESLLCTTPVICTDGAPWEMLNDKKSGWSTDFQNLTKTLRKAMSVSYEDLLTMGNNGRDWIKTSYSWKRVAIEIINEYEKSLTSQDHV